MKPWIHSVTDDSAWTIEDVERDRSWEVVVTPKQQEELVAALKEILESIKWRHQTVKNMIEWRKFTSGAI